MSNLGVFLFVLAILLASLLPVILLDGTIKLPKSIPSVHKINKVQNKERKKKLKQIRADLTEQLLKKGNAKEYALSSYLESRYSVKYTLNPTDLEIIKSWFVKKGWTVESVKFSPNKSCLYVDLRRWPKEMDDLY